MMTICDAGSTSYVILVDGGIVIGGITNIAAANGIVIVRVTLGAHGHTGFPHGLFFRQ